VPTTANTISTMLINDTGNPFSSGGVGVGVAAGGAKGVGVGAYANSTGSDASFIGQRLPVLLLVHVMARPDTKTSSEQATSRPQPA
jgi:hypothetical protein